ncbi:MAG: glycosyltransferase family 4 protein, partial [Chloroflexi bacterium]|nr:glycosyltransferase family 4 protein [Chloroflexota bacterium]
FGTFKSIDRFIALTEFAAEKIIESGIAPRAKISILGNFIQIPPIRIVEKRKPYVVYLGRWSSEKGIDVLIGAMDGLSDIELKIAGNGPQLKSLSELAEKRKLGHVHFIGYVEGKKKLKLLSEAQAIIVPSVCYEIPLTVFGKWQLGLHIASNIGGLSTIIEDHKSGLLFDVSDSDALRKLISYLRDNPSQIVEMGHYARSVVATHYTETPHYDRLMQIYNELLP